ncbi:MAG TPA: Fe-S cluster assembly ATPase SufC [Paenalcaligenes hominis]|uniref:Fe-S cluster assembly ATP-binding protein n=1 Tax=Paenalcaligenes hominis TaxID=643674 RepID=A0A9D2VG36_9BURK|nr:Fe-S cluster assembly ATPase SufC [Paenalcaligenes hominis]NJB65771.1 Fe-S cluster assembly ATP-binding protein [Paenalcaligenes hominis]GGE69553.1 ABC transporter ATP-binding protein [Paenalcaligenes hominis]HJH23986.1 Fe-S cluster assembly ATPase SufC [Paenalcaligenes hominis]
MLKINDLYASVEGKQILRGLSLDVKPGEVHAIMGPNGSGKSTLSQVLAGREDYTVDSGSVEWLGQDLLDMNVEERARSGLFLAFQYPIEIPGVSNAYFLRTAVNAVRREQGKPELDAIDFLKLVKQEMKDVGMREEFLHRSVNEGFSGGEKKRNEVLQMSLLEPKLAILDETDSGLDIDALRVVSDGVNRLRSPDRSMVVITHYQRLLDYIVPDFVHVLAGGRIVRSGDASLAKELEERGYGWVLEQAGVDAKGVAV